MVDPMIYLRKFAVGFLVMFALGFLGLDVGVVAFIFAGGFSQVAVAEMNARANGVYGMTAFVKGWSPAETWGTLSYYGGGIMGLLAHLAL